MTGKDIINYAAAGALDVLSVFGIPTAVAGQLYQDVLAKRAKEGMEVLLLEVRGGNFQNIDQNEAVSIIARYQRDAMEGVAKNNLRLMARVINGMAAKNELKAPTFLKYANILASLTEDEIMVLAVMSKLQWEVFASGNGAVHFEKAGIKNYLQIQQSLLRTGLVMMQIRNLTHSDARSIENLRDFNQINVQSQILFTTTPLMREILKYADPITQVGAG
jgi:hypothetical protein